MNLFLAAVYTNQYRQSQKQYQHFNAREAQIVDNLPHILESYHYVGKQRFVDEMRASGGKVFLDSGAFSAKSLGVDIDINGYCDYIIRNRDILRVEDGVVMASVLDGIGDPLLTWQNQLYMEQRGATPLPCFHFGEDERYLEWYVERYPYITIGGMVRTSAEDVMQWLDRIWNRYLLDGSGRPRLKVHAFGVTTISLMERYPWHSVDSSSWIQAASFGSIYTVEHGPVAVSALSPSRHEANRHLSTLPEVVRQHIEQQLADEGFNYERLSTVYQSRAAFNMLGYMKLNVELNNHFAETGGVLDCHKVQQLF
jgi:hypothetical protein